MNKKYDLILLLDRFINDSIKGRHLQKNGTRLRTGTIQNYKSLRTILLRFVIHTGINLTVTNLIRCTQKQYLLEKNRWKRIYKKFTDFLYNNCNNHDNYVGNLMKMLRAIFNYLRIEMGIETRDISRLFYVCREEIPIIVLNQEQLSFLITNNEFEESLPKRLQRVKDVFIIGCTTGLRISDLRLLTKKNLERNLDQLHLKVFAKKTGSFTRIKLPDYASRILLKYLIQPKATLPTYHLFTFNKYCREIAEKAGWTHTVEKVRSKRGRSKTIKIQNSNKPYRFCDLITSHTMRRTAITMYLTMGMPEQLVRRISGHSPASKEFFRYVKYSDALLDKELDIVHQKFQSKT